MRTIKLSVLLPSGQFLLSLGLLLLGRHYPDRQRGMDTPFAPTATMLCHGLTAPAEIFRHIASYLFPTKVNSEPFAVFGLGLDDSAFLLGVVLVWYLVGRRLETGKSPVGASDRTSRSVSFFSNTLLVLWGVYVLVVCVSTFGSPRSSPSGGNFVGNAIEGILFLLWSLLMISVGIRSFVTGLGRPPREQEI